MSETVQLTGDNQIEFILSDGNYVLQAADSQNIIYDDGTILFNDHLNNTIVLQQVDDSVYVNSDEVLLSENDDNEFVINEDESKCIQYIDNNGTQFVEYQCTTVGVLSEDEDSSKPIPNSIGQVINSKNKYQYAILHDEEFQVENFIENLFQENQQSTKSMDISEVTGKNLITGQTVHLDSYLNNINKRLTLEEPINAIEHETKPNTPIKNMEMHDLLNKEIPLVKKVNGKKIVGKIVQVSNKEDIEVIKQSNSPIDNEINTQYLDLISRTLSGLMEMESIKKILQNAFLIVRIVLRKYLSDSYSKKISFMKGIMNEVNYIDESRTVRWEFVVDNNLDIRGHHQQVTISINEQANGHRTVRVVLDSNQYSSQCHLCETFFQSKTDLRSHIKQVHGEVCVLCKKLFLTRDAFNKHQKEHVNDGQLLECEMCKKTFRTNAKLRRHYAIHKSNTYECNLCQIKFSNETAFRRHTFIHMKKKLFNCVLCDKSYSSQTELKTHLKTHDETYKSRFACNVCRRTFSRQSNLQRHVAIHRGTGTLHICQICGCSYHFASSLTRHMIQYHMNALSRNSN